MPRHPRVHAQGLLYHVMARGNDGRKVFLKDSDYEAFLDGLAVVRKRYPFYLYAYVLMSNHFHLLLEVQQASTGRVLQSLLTGYARRFNRTHRHRGHLFQGRYKAIVCDRDSYLLELVRYIHLNPVRAKMVKRPGEWQWSGHGEILRQGETRADRSRAGDGRASHGGSIRSVRTGGSQGNVPGGMASWGSRAFFGIGAVR